MPASHSFLQLKVQQLIGMTSTAPFLNSTMYNAYSFCQQKYMREQCGQRDIITKVVYKVSSMVLVPLHP